MKKKYSLSLLLLLLLVTPLTIFFMQQQTSYKQHAAEKQSDTVVEDYAQLHHDFDNTLARYKVCRHNQTPRKCLQEVAPSVFPTLDPVLPPDDDGSPALSPATSGAPVVSPAITTDTQSNGPASAYLFVQVCLHDIGICGDNVSSGSGNMSPLHPTRDITVAINNAQNQPVQTVQGTVTFDKATGHFTGTIPVQGISPGSYIFKDTVPGYLAAVVPGIQTIVANQTTTLPLTTLVTGDITHDNIINIQDYTILMVCYSDLQQTSTCSDTDKIAAVSFLPI